MDLFGEPTEPEEKIIETDLSEAVEEAEEFGAPRAMNFCLGHDGVEQKLLEHFNSGRMPHGLIFAGPKGIGKATLAYRLAKFLLHYGVKDHNQDSLFGDAAPAPESLAVDPGAQGVRLVMSGAHPDLMSIERAYDATKNTHKDSVDVASIRKVAPFLHMTASYGGWRVVIIDDADTMNRNAQNALLKILEEPPENTVLILVTHRLGALIPTIRSRTQLVNFQPLSAPVMQDLLERSGQEVSLSDVETLMALSNGSFGEAVRYIEEGGLDMLQSLSEMIAPYPHWDWPGIHAQADNLGRAGAAKSYEMFSGLFIWAVSQLVLCKAKGVSLSNPALDKPGFQALLQNSSLEELLKICDNLHDHFAKVKYANLDKRQGVLQAFSLITVA